MPPRISQLQNIGYLLITALTQYLLQLTYLIATWYGWCNG